jgi:hypothetical protein
VYNAAGTHLLFYKLAIDILYRRYPRLKRPNREKAGKDRRCAYRMGNEVIFLCSFLLYFSGESTVACVRVEAALKILNPLYQQALE